MLGVESCHLLDREKLVEITVCNLYTCMYVYVYCGEPPGSGSSSPWKHPGNAVLNTKNLQLSIMSGTAAAHDGRSLKPGEKTHWGDWTEAP